MSNLQREDCYSGSLMRPCFNLWAQQLAIQLTIGLFRSQCSSRSIPVPIAREKAKSGVALAALLLLCKHIPTGIGCEYVTADHGLLQGVKRLTPIYRTGPLHGWPGSLREQRG